MTFELINLLKTHASAWLLRAVMPVSVMAMLTSTTMSFAFVQSKTDWLSDKDGNPVFHIRVEAENADGSSAKDCVVHARAREEDLTVTRDGEIHRIDLCPEELDDFYNFRVIAKSSDGQHIAHLLVPDYQVRQLARDGIKLRLQPARTVEIKVRRENAAVPDANVKIEGIQNHPVARTDENGNVRFTVARGNAITSIGAWTTSRKMVGSIGPRNLKGMQAESNEFQLELNKCHDLKVTVKDPDGIPISFIDVAVRASQPAPSYDSLPFGDLRNIKTDENGEAIFEWMPDWEEYRLIAFPESADWQRDKSKETDEGLIVQFKPVIRKPRKKVTGKIKLPPGELGGFLLTAHTFQGEQDHRSDVHSVFVDAVGNYELNILQGSTYTVHVNDASWGSNIWDGLIYDSTTDELTLPQIQLVRKVPVEIVATQGADRKPIRDLNINMANPHRYSWLEDGRRQSGNAERRWWAQTDENGIARTLTTPGEVKTSVYLPDWRTQKTTMTRPGETTRIELHRSTAGSQSISGKISIPDRANGSLGNCRVIAFAADGESSGKAETTTSDNGEFQINLPGTRIAYLIASPDGRFAASGITAELEQLRIDLHPCGTYRGRLVNEQSEPCAECRFSIEANISFPRGDLGLASSFAALKLETVTDANGKFEFNDRIPANIKLKCRAETADGKTHHVETLFFEPGEVREKQLVTIDDSVRLRISDYPLSRIFASKVNDARLINAHVLVVINQQQEQIEKFIDSHCLDYNNNKDVGRYLTMQIDDSRNESKDDADFLSEHNWPIPDENEVTMLAVGPDGKELGSTKINIHEENAAGNAASFITRYVPDQIDAKAKFEQALAEARKTDRKVWARICQTRCGPCFLLSRWIDDNREQLEKEYVLYKVDNVNEENGMEIYKKIMPDQGIHGVPFHAVFDSQGNKLIDSRNALGNIGFPGSSYEGKKHLKKMLSLDLKHLKPQEVQKIIDSLE